MKSRYAQKDLTAAGTATKSIHCGITPDPVTGSILTPIYQTATYAQEQVGVDKGHTYSRASNPTVSVLEKKLAGIEGVEYALCFATGMAATTTLLLSILRAGEHIVCSDVVYGGTVRLIEQVLDRFDITASYVDASNPENISQAIKDNTRLIFIETPANPTLKLNDIKKIAAIAHKHKLPLAVDNTFLSPILQKPFDLGADIVIYSTTKYIDGHNATVGGALLTKNQDYHASFDFNRKTLGSIQSPFDAWLIIQGLKTLDLRIKKHSENALIIAKFLEEHHKVAKVIYPGLKSFPQYKLAQRQHLGSCHGGIIAFEVVGGYKKAIKVMNSVLLSTLAESLGAVESLITHPASMTHGPIPKKQRNKIGITDGLIRLSVGLENPEDIIADLNAALN